MKMIMFVLSFTISLFVQAQTLPKYSELDERIKTIDHFVEQSLPKLNQKIEADLKQISDYKNSKFVPQDEKQKALYLEKINLIKKEIESNSYGLITYSLKRQMDELKKIIDEKEKYDNAKKAYEKLEKNNQSSNKLSNYFSSLKNGKYTKARVQYALLNASEKLTADEYEKNLTYTIRESNNQSFLKNEIAKLKGKIVADLSNVESNVTQIKKQDNDEVVTMASFNLFTEDLEQNLQFDYTLPSTWDMGLFSCDLKNKPKYLRFKNYPNLVVLDNDGAYNSVIKLSPSSPSKLDLVYKCQKLGSFGSCLENKEKKLCLLDSDCGQSLTSAEAAFDRNSFFKSVLPSMPSEILKKKKEEYKNPANVNLISEFAKMDRLGFYSTSEIYGLFDILAEKSKGIQANSPEDFYKKIKVEIANIEKAEKIRLQGKPGYSSNSGKGKDSLQVLTYMMNTLDSEMKTMTESDVIQEYSFKACPNGEQELFCQHYSAFKEKAKTFQAVEEIQNFVPDQCPRVVFRFESRSPESKSMSETPANFSGCQAISPLRDLNISNLIDNLHDIEEALE